MNEKQQSDLSRHPQSQQTGQLLFDNIARGRVKQDGTNNHAETHE